MGRIDDRTMHRHAENGGIVRRRYSSVHDQDGDGPSAARLLSFPSICPVCARDNERERERKITNWRILFVSTILKILKFRAKLTKYLESNRYLYYEKIKED